jgi:hypothetical protein
MMFLLKMHPPSMYVLDIYGFHAKTLRLALREGRGCGADSEKFHPKKIVDEGLGSFRDWTPK